MGPICTYTCMVTGLLRQKYGVLQSTLPIDYPLCSDKEGNRCCPMVIRVCCPLTNLCPSLSICVHLTECCFNNNYCLHDLFWYHMNVLCKGSIVHTFLGKVINFSYLLHIINVLKVCIDRSRTVDSSGSVNYFFLSQVIRYEF